MLEPAPEVPMETHRAWCRHLKRLGQLSHRHRACTETTRCVADSVGPSEQSWRYQRADARG